MHAGNWDLLHHDRKYLSVRKNIKITTSKVDCFCEFLTSKDLKASVEQGSNSNNKVTLLRFDGKFYLGFYVLSFADATHAPNFKV